MLTDADTCSSQLRYWLLAAGAIVVAAVVVGDYVQLAEGIPDNALVIANLPTHQYVSPPCLAREAIAREFFEAGVPMTFKDAEAKHLQPDARCLDSDGLDGASWTLLRQILISTGLAARPSRFTPDGDWRW